VAAITTQKINGSSFGILRTFTNRFWSFVSAGSGLAESAFDHPKTSHAHNIAVYRDERIVSEQYSERISVDCGSVSACRRNKRVVSLWMAKQLPLPAPHRLTTSVRGIYVNANNIIADDSTSQSTCRNEGLGSPSSE
jgi:hypothetical protein